MQIILTTLTYRDIIDRERVSVRSKMAGEKMQRELEMLENNCEIFFVLFRECLLICNIFFSMNV